jgi:thermitase
LEQPVPRGQRRNSAPPHAARRRPRRQPLALLLAIVALLLCASPASAIVVRPASPAGPPISATAPNGATQLLVQLRDQRDTPASDSRIARGLRSQREMELPSRAGADIHVLAYADAASANAAFARLRDDPRVLTVEPNATRQLAWDPDDEHYADERWWLDDIHAPQAWDITTGSSQIVVAVVDSGVSSAQPDLANRLVGGYNAVTGGSDASDIDGHGTHVAGIIAASGNDQVGTAGVAMDVRIMPVRVMDADGAIDVSAEIDGIYWAVDHGANVINLSLGAEDYVALERQAIQYARDRGVVVVAAAGNDFNKIAYPANYPETISVGSLNADGNPSTFTSRLTRLDLAAPGESIYSPGWTKFFGYYWDDIFYSNFSPVSGTSFSAPMVAGAAALLKSIDPAASVEDVRGWLTATATDSGDAGHEAGTGAGELNVEGALRAATYSAMQSVWTRTDAPVASGATARSWLWGSGADSYVYEPYDEAQHGTRLVYYYDKSRMEVTDPLDDRAQQWYVTNGLLVTEMITGLVQLGDTHFQPRPAAQVNVAGDPDDANGPTYASFSDLRYAAPLDNGALVDQTLARDGTVSAEAALDAYGVTGGQLVAETNHRVASVFWDYLNSTGTIQTPDGLADGRLFEPWFYATGYPITEAYWANVKVAGVVQDVLVQCFERRCLTYTPGNAAGWQVEMGNVGRHYYQWRYGAQLPEAAAAP